MPASSISLDSLSSPSPTPSPPPPRAKGSTTHKSQAAHTNNKQPAPPHGLGSDSELSELTEEEQDGAEKRTNAPNASDGGRPATGDDESAGGTSVGGGASTGTSGSASRRATQKASSTGGKRGGGRKKRSSLVPAPMWGWAESKASNAHEEEEEEEVSGPPEAMKEEEEEGEEGDEDGSAGVNHPASTSSVRKPRGRRLVSRNEDGDIDDARDVYMSHGSGNALNGSVASPHNAASGSDGGSDQEEEEAESEEAESEEEKNTQSESDGDQRRGKRKEAIQIARPRGGWPSRRQKVARKYAGAYAPGPRWSDPEDDSASSKDSDEEVTEGEEGSENDNEKEEGDGDGDGNVVDPPVDNPSGTIPGVEDCTPTIISSATLKAAASPPKAPIRVVDHTGPLVEAIAPIAAAAAASSIMAGSEVIDPPSPGTSTSSRLNSPDPAAIQDVIEPPKKKATKPKDEVRDDTPAGVKMEKKDKSTKHAPAPPDMDVDPPEVEGDGDHQPSLEADADELENEQEQEAEVENEVEAEAEEPSPDDDLEVELESDLQPAHRAEALDVLATIELKFALLRERVYVEKMEGLAWEEKLVNEGSHPELIHIQKELLKRRDKRLELASRKREYELANISKKRRTNEDSTWSWWKLARDELQTDMIAETSRKRRRLERERRAVERPQPIRRVPMPPSEVPPAPSLRRIVKSFPLADKQKPRNSQSTPKQGVYPELTGLTASEINADLEVFFSNRRGYDFRGNPVIGFPAQIAPPLGFPGYDAYSDHTGNSVVPPGRIPPQHAPPFAHQVQPPLAYSYSNQGGGRVPPPPPGHGHPPPHGGPPVPGMYPMDDMIGAIPHSVPPHHYYGSQVNGGTYPEGVPPPGPPMAGPPSHHGRRSPSPMNGVANGKQPHSGWIGPGLPPGAGPAPLASGGYPGPGQVRPKGEWVAGDDRRRDYPMGVEEEERERLMRDREQREEKREIADRERDKQRELRERERERDGMLMDVDRERHMQMMAQHRQVPPGNPVSGPPPPPPMHPHVHGMSGQHHHIVGGHHHPRAHHHHVVHHHHAPPGPGGPPPPGSVMHSPRAPKEYGEIRPGSGHGQYPTEVINLSSKHGPPPTHRDDHSMSRDMDFRDRERDREKERARISRKSSPVPGPSSQPQSQSQSQGPTIVGPPPSLLESDRPIPTPFAMASTQTMQATSMNGTSSPRGYDGHIRSPEHRFSSISRSVPPTAGPSTPSAGPPPSVPSSTSSGNRDGSAMSPPRRLPPPQSPTLLHERESERDLGSLGGIGGITNPDGRGNSNGCGVMQSPSPRLPRQRSPGTVKFGPPPPPPPGPSAMTSGPIGPAGSSGVTGRTSSVGSKLRAVSPVGQIGKNSINQPLVSPRIVLAGPGRAGTPVGSERRDPFTSPSARSANGVTGGTEGGEREREVDKAKDRVLEEPKAIAGLGVPAPATSLLSSPNASAATSSPVTLPPPSKMSLPQMVDGP